MMADRSTEDGTPTNRAVKKIVSGIDTNIYDVVFLSPRNHMVFILLLDKDAKKVKPHVLLGLSGVGGIFTEKVLKAMQESDSVRPAIFAMSNPTANC
ncbi:hypothetical protein GIB67_003103 [Kingdonia uniflora]|uniref:Malic enzyme NAD-binding domain-containing protein n=1 Tax=Kingdonia uniflora TaxID=39325 RepID=A0A7J7N5Z9_9MAGN|nr:hypothetical protein GIB67_003103 [Kingdonia uniflora]